MTKELNKILNEDGTPKEEPPAPSDINKSLETSLQEEKESRGKAEAENANLKFTIEFKDQLALYPLAKDHEDDIKAKVKSGYTVEDAVIAVLNKANKLKTADQISADENRGRDLGGSARTPNLNQPNSQEKTAEELGKELQEFERKGEFRLQ